MPDYLKPNSIGGIDLYAYGLNNPVMYVDPTGHEWYDVLAWVGLGLVIASAIALTGGVASAGVAGFIIAGAAKGVLIGAAVGAATGAAGGWMEHSLKGINQTLGGKIGMSLATSYLGTVLEAGLTMESLTALSFVNATLIGGLDVYLSYYIKYEFLINLILEIVDNIVGLFE